MDILQALVADVQAANQRSDQILSCVQRSSAENCRRLAVTLVSEAKKQPVSLNADGEEHPWVTLQELSEQIERLRETNVEQ